MFETLFSSRPLALLVLLLGRCLCSFPGRAELKTGLASHDHDVEGKTQRDPHPVPIFLLTAGAYLWGILLTRLVPALDVDILSDAAQVHLLNGQNPMFLALVAVWIIHRNPRPWLGFAPWIVLGAFLADPVLGRDSLLAGRIPFRPEEGVAVLGSFAPLVLVLVFPPGGAGKAIPLNMIKGIAGIFLFGFLGILPTLLIWVFCELGSGSDKMGFAESLVVSGVAVFSREWLAASPGWGEFPGNFLGAATFGALVFLHGVLFRNEIDRPGNLEWSRVEQMNRGFPE